MLILPHSVFRQVELETRPTPGVTRKIQDLWDNTGAIQWQFAWKASGIRMKFAGNNAFAIMAPVIYGKRIT